MPIRSNPVGLLAAACAITALAGPAGALAAPGSLDSGFGSGGVAALASGTRVLGVAAQAGGGLVGAGTDGSSLLAARLSAGGTLDGSFGAGGIAIGAAGSAGAVALQPDGRVVAAATSGGLIAERFTAAGAPDPAFGSGGVARAAALGATATGNAVAIEPNGRIVVAGSIRGADGFTRIALARFNSDGSPDSSFGSGGAQVLDFGSDSIGLGLAVQADGKIVLVGHQVPGLQVTNAFVARLTDSGGLDPGFGSGGAYFYYHPAGGGYSSLNAVTLQTDGRIVAAGVDLENSGPHALLVRLGTGGAPDGRFNGSGVQTLTSATPNTIGGDPIGAFGVGIAGGGRIVAAGDYSDNGLRELTLWAVGADGAPDASFGVGGMVRAAPSGSTQANALAVAADGGLVAAGDSSSSFGGGGPTGFLARYVGFGPPPAGGGGAPTGGGGPGSGGGGPGDASSAPPTAGLQRLARSYKLSSSLNKGLTIGVRCSAACRVTGSLEISRSAARKLRIAAKRGNVVLARGSGALAKAGTLNLRLRFTPAAKRGLARQKRVTVLLRVTATASSGATVSLSRHTVLQR